MDWGRSEAAKAKQSEKESAEGAEHSTTRPGHQQVEVRTKGMPLHRAELAADIGTDMAQYAVVEGHTTDWARFDSLVRPHSPRNRL